MQSRKKGSMRRASLVLSLAPLAAASEAHGADAAGDNKMSRLDRQTRLAKLPSMPTDIAWAGYYAGVEAFANSTWQDVIMPRIVNSSFHHVLEISPGGGRWADIFVHKLHADSYIGVDINRPAIEALAKSRFANASRCDFYANDGMTLPMVKNRSVSFAFSWDSMVHFPPAAVESYISELGRVLHGGATAFLHHGNLRLCNISDPCLQEPQPHIVCDIKVKPAAARAAGATGNDAPPPLAKGLEAPNGHTRTRGIYAGAGSCGIPTVARKNPQARNAGTTCESVARAAAANGLVVLHQERYKWGTGAFAVYDCLSYLGKPRGGHHGQVGQPKERHGGVSSLWKREG